MYTRVFKPPNRSFFLLGPRGTGKTTWLKFHYKNAVFYDLLDYSTYLRLLKDPSLFKKELSILNKKTTIVIDEVQRLPRLLDDVHYFLSLRNNPLRFILSGSSARKLRSRSANLLAGRASQRFLYSLVYAEHQSTTSIHELLKYGSLPEVLSLKKPEDKVEFLEAYVNIYLREEIQQEALVKNIESFSRFLDIAAITNAQTTNLSSISRDAGVARASLQNYFQVLEDTLIGKWLRVWRPRIRIKEVYAPKFFFFDTGVARALSNQLRQNVSVYEKGFLLETYILHELKVWNQKHNWNTNIYFWKTYSKAEIDFILEIGNKKIGIEVKATSNWKPEFGKHLNKAKEEKSIERSIGVYLGERKLKHKNLEIFPVFEFLKILEKNKLLQ